MRLRVRIRVPVTVSAFGLSPLHSTTLDDAYLSLAHFCLTIRFCAVTFLWSSFLENSVHQNVFIDRVQPPETTFARLIFIAGNF